VCAGLLHHQTEVARSRRTSVRRLGPIHGWPLFGERWEKLLFSGNSFYGNCVHGNDVQAREVALGPGAVRFSILVHELLAEFLLPRPISYNSDFSEGDTLRYAKPESHSKRP
jgi:hypothetical protein